MSGPGIYFRVVNDEVLIPAMLRHGRTLSDAARHHLLLLLREHDPGLIAVKSLTDLEPRRGVDWDTHPKGNSHEQSE